MTDMFSKPPYVFDTETTIHSPLVSKAHPCWPANHIVWYGSSVEDAPLSRCMYAAVGVDEVRSELRGVIRDYVLTGHNLKFDLMHLLEGSHITPEQLYQADLWDTQVVEYLLSAQQSSFPSLDSCAVKYGGTVKPSSIKEYWEKGISTEHIPAHEIVPYLEGDVLNTGLVQGAQKKLVERYGMQKLVESQMMALKTLTHMEINGMTIDTEYVNKRCEELGWAVAEGTKILLEHVATSEWPEGIDFLPSSNKHLSTLLFGGNVEWLEKELVGTYKNGNPKYRNVTKSVCLPALANTGLAGATKTKLGWYTVDDDVLKNISTGPHIITGKVIADLVMQIRKLSKQKETYFENLRSLVFPDGKVHPSLNQCLTKTGRLSCAKPNIQNQTEEGGIKRAYISRWGDDGVLVDFDYSQLEMAGLAIISGDEQLIYDINNGIDMHIELFREMYGRTPTAEERKKFKPLSFGLVYGAGYKTLAANAGCTEAEAKKFIKVFYGRYKGVAEFHKSIVQEAKDKGVLTASHTEKGKPRKAFLKRMDTGRMYMYMEYDNDWNPDPSFSPTELKNWLIQGFSTGDIVPHMVGVIGACLQETDMKDVALPIMTVHDSIVFDVHKNVLDRATKFIYNILSNTSEIVAEHFGIDIPVKLQVGCKVGPNWQDMEEIKF